MGGAGSQGIEEEGRTLVERLGGRWSSNGGLCRCPAHDDRTPSLSVRPGRKRLLLHCFAGCNAEQILAALARDGKLLPGAAREGSDPITCNQGPSGSAAARIWAASRSIDGTAALDYLVRRGLQTNSPELRFNRQTPSGRAPLTEMRPALIAAVRDDSGLVGIQRTFLDIGKSGGVRRAALGRFGSGAVRLGRSTSALGLAEGIETALSASRLFGIACWATLGSERFGLVSIPAEVEELHLFLDNDRGGRRAGRLARERFRALRIHVHVPPRAGEDWNDVLQHSGKRTGADLERRSRPIAAGMIGMENGKPI